MNVQKEEVFDEQLYNDYLRELNDTYDSFVSQYGYLTKNINIIKDDISYATIYSLELMKVGENDKIFYEKSDIFFEPTIINKGKYNISNINDGLALSLAKKGKIDIDYIKSLLGYSEKQVLEELEGRVFQDPFHPKEYILASEYLSGDVKTKLDNVNKLIDLNKYNSRIFGDNEKSIRELAMLEKNKKALEQVIQKIFLLQILVLI